MSSFGMNKPDYELQQGPLVDTTKQEMHTLPVDVLPLQ
jgi:hypothetical protein